MKDVIDTDFCKKGFPNAEQFYYKDVFKHIDDYTLLKMMERI